MLLAALAFLLVVVISGVLIWRRVFNPASAKVETRRLVDRVHLGGVIKEQIEAHRKYEHERVHKRKRPGWHHDQMVTAVAQRVVRELYAQGLVIDLSTVLPLVKEALR